ncbi:MAG: sigma-54-dependent transcriptional regulator [Phycisphaerae bacterium]
MASRSLGRILLVEDDQGARQAIAQWLIQAGYEVKSVSDGREALGAIDSSVHLVISDLWMPRMDGLALLEEVRQREPAAEFVMITGNATVPSAVRAMKLGAFDYLLKTFAPPDLLEVVQRAMEHRRVKREINELLPGGNRTPKIDNFIGRSPQMLEIARTIERVAAFKSTVLVEGESGTGKELVVRAIHQFSPRADKPLIAINCAAVPSSLMESELFGHERGAFTGANERTSGYFEAASGGTLFIDEVGELEAGVQAKLLRVLESGMVTAVGSTRERAIDVRVLAATNADLAALVESRRFRADLFYRLNVVRIKLPPLRERIEDIPLLVESLTQRLCTEHGLPARTVSPDFISALQQYSWPGNIRELRNLLETLLVLEQKPELQAADLPAHIRQARADHTLDLEGAEREAIERALRAQAGDRAAAAEQLGISVRTLYRKMAKYGLD